MPTHAWSNVSLRCRCSHPVQDGATPLDYAAQKNASEVARLLLQKEAEINAPDAVGEAWWWRGACAVA